MGKKKNKKRSYFEEYELAGKKRKKDSKKAMKKELKKKAKSVQPTLSKKDGKAMKKIVTKPVKIDKEFLKQRAKCNHADGKMTPAEFLEMSPTASAYTPMLQPMIDVFGEEHVQICGRCFEALVDRSEISSKMVKDALAVIYAACGVVTANTKLKGDEVKKINHLKEVVEDFQPVIELLSDIEDDEETTGASGNLNDVGMEID